MNFSLIIGIVCPINITEWIELCKFGHWKGKI